MTVTVETTYLKGRKPDDLVKELKKMNIKCVVDIRYSFNYPAYFRPMEMEILMNKNDIFYLRYHKLGNPPEIRYMEDNVKRSDFYKAYILNGKEQTLHFKILYKMMRLEPEKYCLICYCPPPNDCHRFWLKDLLENDNLKIPDVLIDVT